MRLTEALIYYNAEKAPPETWMRLYFTHFSPTIKDAKTRDALKRIQDKLPKKGRKKMETYE